jgi:hypothetical protein
LAGEGATGEQLHLRSADGIADHLPAAECRLGQRRQAEHIAIELAHGGGAFVREAPEHVDLADLRLRALAAPKIGTNGCRRAALRGSLPRDDD